MVARFADQCLSDSSLVGGFCRRVTHATEQRQDTIEPQRTFHRAQAWWPDILPSTDLTALNPRCFS